MQIICSLTNSDVEPVYSTGAQLSYANSTWNTNCIKTEHNYVNEIQCVPCEMCAIS